MTRFICLLIALAPSLVVAEPPKFIKVPVVSNFLQESTLLSDIVNRCSNRRGDGWGPVLGHSRSTNGHESTHRLNASLRQDQYDADPQKRTWNAFYQLDGKALVCLEPKMRKSIAADFIPGSLRLSRMSYVNGASDWEDRPLYIAEEWCAYINDCEVAYDDAVQGRGHSGTDQTRAVLEMGLYSIGMAMAVEKYDPATFNGPDFKMVINYQWARSKRVCDRAASTFPDGPYDQLIKNLRTSPDAQKMRDFITKHLDSVWLTDKPARKLFE